jgi:hypothetical protein
LRWARRDALTASNGDNLTKLADALAALKAERAELRARLDDADYRPSEQMR